MKIKPGSEFALVKAKEAISLNPEINPWDFWPGVDTQKSYSVFCLYRDMGTDRTIEKLLSLLGRTLGYIKQLYNWCSWHDWVARTCAWDLHIDKIKREAVVKTEVRQHVSKLKRYRNEIEVLGWQNIAIAQKCSEIASQYLAKVDTAKIEEMKTTDVRNIVLAGNSCSEQGLKALNEALAVGQLLEQLSETLEITAADETLDVSYSDVS